MPIAQNKRQLKKSKIKNTRLSRCMRVSKIKQIIPWSSPSHQFKGIVRTKRVKKIMDFDETLIWNNFSISGTAEKRCFKPLREKNNGKKSHGHVSASIRDKPPQVVAKRNARERRRVQAVNSAFVKLRKAIPIQNARSKRISKVKTLQNAIRYIRALEEILQNNSNGPDYYGFDDNISVINNYEDFSNNSFCYDNNLTSRTIES
ncbi:unnamed protein product [Brassicogethes aeneus]|uniref:BHLH domain-containing protein n=1 Tax=Brassicogethes aeneus TaxID=1431903 RepID=A0A9P0FKV1_BRAAE|nr:unnamed protein product [Brassicogethes aeneus]